MTLVHSQEQVACTQSGLEATENQNSNQKRRHQTSMLKAKGVRELRTNGKSAACTRVLRRAPDKQCTRHDTLSIASTCLPLFAATPQFCSTISILNTHTHTHMPVHRREPAGQTLSRRQLTSLPSLLGNTSFDQFQRHKEGEKRRNVVRVGMEAPVIKNTSRKQRQQTYIAHIGFKRVRGAWRVC